MRPQDILAPESLNRQRFLAMIRKYLLGENSRYRNPGAPVILPIIKRLSAANVVTRLCSVQCPLWGKCPLEEGGLPCRMPDEEFNDKLAGMGLRGAKMLMPPRLAGL
jgi:hypothetical protein